MDASGGSSVTSPVSVAHVSTPYWRPLDAALTPVLTPPMQAAKRVSLFMYEVSPVASAPAAAAPGGNAAGAVAGAAGADGAAPGAQAAAVEVEWRRSPQDRQPHTRQEFQVRMPTDAYGCLRTSTPSPLCLSRIAPGAALLWPQYCSILR